MNNHLHHLHLLLLLPPPLSLSLAPASQNGPAMPSPSRLSASQKSFLFQADRMFQPASSSKYASTSHLSRTREHVSNGIRSQPTISSSSFLSNQIQIHHRHHHLLLLLHTSSLNTTSPLSVLRVSSASQILTAVFAFLSAPLPLLLQFLLLLLLLLLPAE